MMNSGTNTMVDRAVADLTACQGELEAARRAIELAIGARISDDGLNYHLIKSRVKSVESVRGKLGKLKPNGLPKYSNGLSDLDDLIGMRVITHIKPDVSRVVTALTGQFNVIKDEDKSEVHLRAGTIGYAAHHLILEVGDDYPAGCGQHIGQRFEVQVKTVLQHAWAEFEHDIRYKSSGDVNPAINRAFTLASGLIELADDQFVTIHTEMSRESQATAPVNTLVHGCEELTAKELTSMLVAELPENPRSRREHYQWLVELMAAVGITTVDEANRLLTEADWDALTERMGYRFIAGHVRILDDLLLSKFGQDYIDKTVSLSDASREGKLKYRLNKLCPADG